MIDGDFSGSMVAIEACWGFPMIDGDFSWFDGIAIGVKGSFILIGTLMSDVLLFPFLGFPLSQSYIIQGDY
jgi:hypothetical protein